MTGVLISKSYKILFLVYYIFLSDFTLKKHTAINHHECMNNYQKNVNQEIKTWEKLNTPSMEKKKWSKLDPQRHQLKRPTLGKVPIPGGASFLSVLAGSELFLILHLRSFIIIISRRWWLMMGKWTVVICICEDVYLPVEHDFC